MDGGVFITVDGVVALVKVKKPTKSQLDHARKEGYEAKTKTLVLVQWMGGQMFLNGPEELAGEIAVGDAYSFRCGADTKTVTKKGDNGDYSVTYHQAKYVIDYADLVEELSGRRAA